MVDAGVLRMSRDLVCDRHRFLDTALSRPAFNGGVQVPECLFGDSCQALPDGAKDRLREPPGHRTFDVATHPTPRSGIVEIFLPFCAATGDALSDSGRKRKASATA